MNLGGTRSQSNDNGSESFGITHTYEHNIPILLVLCLWNRNTDAVMIQSCFRSCQIRTVDILLIFFVLYSSQTLVGNLILLRCFICFWTFFGKVSEELELMLIHKLTWLWFVFFTPNPTVSEPMLGLELYLHGWYFQRISFRFHWFPTPYCSFMESYMNI